MKSEFYVDMSDGFSVSVYKKNGKKWWRLGGWSSGDIVFTACAKPEGSLSPIGEITTLIDKHPPFDKMKWNIFTEK